MTVIIISELLLMHIQNTLPSNQQTEMEQKFKSAIIYAGLVAQAHTPPTSQSTANLINNCLPQLTKNHNTNHKVKNAYKELSIEKMEQY